MKKLVARVGMVAGIILMATMLWLYFATEHGVYETEPVGVVRLREQRASGEPSWLSGQVAWLRLDGTHIDYPVMQASDNRWYLNHDYYSNDSASGAVFLDFRNSALFSDYVSIIYGHRMNGDLMFSDVAKYRDADYFAAHRTGELILPIGTIKLRAVSFREISADDNLYRNLSLSGFNYPILVLSTCDRDNHNLRDVLILEMTNET